jgi:hypothetical protein
MTVRQWGFATIWVTLSLVVFFWALRALEAI